MKASLILGQIIKSLKADVTVFNLDISGCTRGLQWLQALYRISQLQQLGLGPTAVTYSEALTVCYKSDQWQRASMLVDDRDVIAQSIAISGQQDWRLSLGLVTDIDSKGIKVDTVLFNAALNACASKARWHTATALWTGLVKLHLRATAITYSTGTTAAARCHLWEMAFQLADGLREDALEPSLVAQSAAIGACVKRWQMSLKMAKGLTDFSMRVNTILFGSVIAAFDEGRWLSALSLLVDLGDRALLMSTVAMNSVMSACRGAVWPRAQNLFSEFATCRHVKVDIISSGSLITACSAQRWVVALESLRSSKSASMKPEPQNVWRFPVRLLALLRTRHVDGFSRPQDLKYMGACFEVPKPELGGGCWVITKGVDRYQVYSASSLCQAVLAEACYLEKHLHILS